MIVVQEEDFSHTQLYDQLRSYSGQGGAIVTFTGLVRDFHSDENVDRETVSGIFLEYYPGMTESSLKSIVALARERWSLCAVSVVHRVGELQPKDQIVFVGVCSEHRQAAFEASHFIMDYLKTQAPFWKKERRASGDCWVDAKTSDTLAAQRWKG
ncbi:molybdopterin synthase catalytic subunit MoaE [Marinibactrum halimedae]|uniref:molybdopterin synthase catalytic subunit MoaE n=1 Tax=Marinibactrum halimedae TaxID=1444977 RepID=UPI0039F693DD